MPTVHFYFLATWAGKGCFGYTRFHTRPSAALTRDETTPASTRERQSAAIQGNGRHSTGLKHPDDNVAVDSACRHELADRHELIRLVSLRERAGSDHGAASS